MNKEEIELEIEKKIEDCFSTLDRIIKKVDRQTESYRNERKKANRKMGRGVNGQGRRFFQ